jgi:hypothetical protein
MDGAGHGHDAVTVEPTGAEGTHLNHPTTSKVVSPVFDWVRRRKVEVLCLVVFVMLGGVPRTISAQDDDVSEQIWLDYNPVWALPDSLELYGDVGVRTELGEQGWGRVVLRPSIRGPVGSFRWSGGIGGFFTGNESIANRFEIRPFQGIAATWPRRRIFHLEHYVRLEERFEWETDTWSLDASLRFRYRLQSRYSFSGPLENAEWQVLLHAEVFATLAGNAGQFDENVRIGAGLERAFGAAWRARLDLTWQRSGKPFSGAPTEDLYVRVRIFQNWM